METAAKLTESACSSRVSDLETRVTQERNKAYQRMEGQLRTVELIRDIMSNKTPSVQQLPYPNILTALPMDYYNTEATLSPPLEWFAAKNLPSSGRPPANSRMQSNVNYKLECPPPVLLLSLISACI